MAENNTLLLPVLPLRDAVFFPGDIPPLFVGREKSVYALEYAMSKDKKLFLVTQKNSSKENPSINDLFKVGVLAHILQLLKLPDGAVKILVKVENRAAVMKYSEKEKFLHSFVEVIEESGIGDGDNKIEALRRVVVNGFKNYAKFNKKVLKTEILEESIKSDSYGRCADSITSYLDIKIEEKQNVLETFNVFKRLEKVYSILESEIDVLNMEKRIRHRVKSQMENTQKAYYLNEQIKAIQKELGDNDSVTDLNDIRELTSKMKKNPLSIEAKEKAESEIKKLKMMSPMSAEATVIRNYLDWLLDMPWGKKTKVKNDLKKAAAILESNHYGMEKAKERIVEHLAVQKKTKELKGPILCLLGAPGVGKTSLAKSIAEATGREFVRMSLGGVRDESEIRGHRKTYIGAMPGKIIQYLKKAKSSNPLFLFDEIDKMGMDNRGDPASALLEVLDPEHNKHFIDHYLEVEYDLSQVMCIATANTLNIPKPLLDRMEVIRISGYTEDEKVNIVNKHMMKSLKKNHGLKGKEITISSEALHKLIRNYTRESGVRGLKRELSNLMRKTVREILDKEKKGVSITVNNLKKYAGVSKYKFGKAEEENLVGIITGLAYMETGGEIMAIESVIMPGQGNIKSTGKLGEVMQESVQAAYSYIRSRCLAFGISYEKFKKYDVHLHVPEGAIPKDGPSAGVAICTSIISVLTGIPIHSSVAMTGEITLRGSVLEIGGLKEKLLAAIRGGISIAVIPKDNEKNLEEMPENIKKNLKIIPVKMAEEALKIALTYMPIPITHDEIQNSEDNKVIDSMDEGNLTSTQH
ncbi:MAG: endopeptidase La [Rickettsiaceae bacterium H1]|nr:endopeptidase La [Rickettsiaceae bacterium H1]